MRWLAICAVALLAVPGHAGTTGQHWVSAFAAPPTEKLPAETVVGGRTIRQMMRLQASGHRLRLRLSNAENADPLRIGSVTIGGVRVTFNGQAAAVIAPGAPLFSDPVARPVKAGERIELRLFLPDVAARPTIHWYGLDTASISPPGDFTADTDFPVATTSSFRFMLSGIDVEQATPMPVIAVVGDSITDGYGATIDGDVRWPDLLARRVAAAKRPASVVNAGIGGNRLLRDGTFTGAGRALLARFSDDVLSLAGVRTMIVLIGINDLGWPGSLNRDGTQRAPATDLPTAGEVIDGYCQLVKRAHARDIRVIGATLLPFGGEDPSHFFTPAKDAIRDEINARLRRGACFDGLIDFDAALRNPAHPDRLLPAYDSGDHVHPSLAGYAAMAVAVDLKLLDQGATAMASTSIK